FPFDGVLRAYLLARAEYFASSRRPGTRREGSRGGYSASDVERWWSERLEADSGAEYAVQLVLDLSSITPHVSGPNHVKTMTPVAEMQARDVKIDKAYLVSCVNARLADIAEAAGVVRGSRVAPGVEFYIAAASADVQAEAERLGHWGALVEAGARALPPGCGPCIGLGAGLVGDGEVAISATNRNFRGRMGSRDAEVYLASPAVVAASAIAGRISAPFAVEDAAPVGSARAGSGASSDRVTGGAAEILDGFPPRLVGRVLYLPADNMNTDGIYAGKWTYQDDLTPEQMAGVVFENYDPAFGRVYRGGDLLVGGRNFGTGSSREQAATALKHLGVACVVAASFSETYLRNAFNNGFLCLECPALVDHLATTLGDGSPTVPGPGITIDFVTSTIACDDRAFPFSPLSTVAQELIVAGGAEALARSALAG
ncbi:MAG: aconitase family protein, partial [Phycisphaerales bacterium JB041]